MKQKRLLIIGVTVSAAVLIALVFFIRSIFFPSSSQANMEQGMMAGVTDPTLTNQAGMDPNAGPESMIYSTYMVYEQDPVSIDGSVQLQSDQQYHYDNKLGKIISVSVKDGQKVKKNDLLYVYEQTDKQVVYDIEDTLRSQTRLYNQREELIYDLSQLTGNAYNYQGDQISNYWESNGKQSYYVISEIGKGGGSSTSVPDDSEGDDSTPTDNSQASGGGEDALKDQIRQLNQQIEDIEIKLIRLKEQQNGRILAQTDGVAIVNEAGKDDASVPFVRIISDEVVVKGSATEYEFYMLGDNRPVSMYINAEDRDVTGIMTEYDKIPAASAASTTTEESPAYTPSGGGQSGTNFNFTIKPDEYIQPGFSVKVNMTMPGLVVPIEAIVEEGDASYVFVYQEDGTVRKQAVDIKVQGTQRVVERGLNIGETVILSPFGLQDGQAVTTDMDMMQQLEPGMDEMQGVKG